MKPLEQQIDESEEHISLVFFILENRPLLILQGRTHFYESNNVQLVLYPIHVAHKLGVETLIITNAAGKIYRIVTLEAMM